MASVTFPPLNKATRTREFVPGGSPPARGAAERTGGSFLTSVTFEDSPKVGIFVATLGPTVAMKAAATTVATLSDDLLVGQAKPAKNLDIGGYMPQPSSKSQAPRCP